MVTGFEVEEVIASLYNERAYQIRRWGVRQPNGGFREVQKPVEAFIVYMQSYLNEAVDQISHDNTDQNALETLRKVVTLGIACFEQHGVPTRDLSLPIINGRDGQDASFRHAVS
jgi:hypothetical protein